MVEVFLIYRDAFLISRMLGMFRSAVRAGNRRLFIGVRGSLYMDEGRAYLGVIFRRFAVDRRMLVCSIRCFIGLGAALASAVSIRAGSADEAHGSAAYARHVARYIIYRFITRTATEYGAVRLIERVSGRKGPLYLFVHRYVRGIIVLRAAFSVNRRYNNSGERHRRFFFSFLSRPSRRVRLRPVNTFGICLYAV